MAAVMAAPGMPVSRYSIDADALSTLPDPRSPADPASPAGSGSSTPHPDLNTEVATLSNKLISAINHQTHLDDALSRARQELETAQSRIAALEAESAERARQLEAGELVKKEAMDEVLGLFGERDRRTQQAEQEKKRMEQELENLTTTLFEEANEMVVGARKETKASEARNDQLRMQLRDTEALLADQQEQLAELKMVMEQMQAREDREGTNSTGPSSPALQAHGDFRQAMEAMQSNASQGHDQLSPAPPTSFSHLLFPVLRMDLAAYEDFRSLAEIAKRLSAPVRSGGAYATGAMPGSLPNFVMAASQVSQSPTQGSVTPSGYPGSPQLSPSLIPLKETRFYKRALIEDIEPTLRLDTAPGLSWLVRRSVISSIVDGSLVIEPMPSATKMFVYPCSLCGENRRDEGFRRTHRFRTSENDSASRYPLCAYCLNRMRATCDYISFLRIIKDGHWRTDSAETEKAAWEESVRLRERMFWARIGGGVVPAYFHRDSPRASSEEKPRTPFSAPLQTNNGAHTTQDAHAIPIHAERTTDLGGIDQRLAQVMAERKAGDGQPDSDKVQSKEPGKDIHESDANELSHDLKLRQGLHEKDLPAAPHHGSALEDSPLEDAHDQGLQITIPGGYN